MGKREAKKGKSLHYLPSALHAKSSLDPLNKSDEFETACTYFLRHVFATRRRRLRLLKLPFSIKAPDLNAIQSLLWSLWENGRGSLLVDPKGLSIFKF